MTLVAVQGSIRLESRTAAAWKAMVADCRAETGVTLLITSPYGGHRTLAQQWAMWRDRSTSTNGKVAWPGTSVHGSGRCVDINNWGRVDGWLRANSRDYGFTRTISGEPWHFQHDGSGGGSGGGGVTPLVALTIYEGDTMHIIIGTEAKGIVIETVENGKTWRTAISPFGKRETRTSYTSLIAPYIKKYGPAVKGTPADVEKAYADRIAATQHAVYVEGALWLPIPADEVAGYAAIIATLREVKKYTPDTFTNPADLARLKATVTAPSQVTPA